MGRWETASPQYEVIMAKYFKKPNGIVIEFNAGTHDLASLKSRFQECDANGKDLKKDKPKAKKK